MRIRTGLATLALVTGAVVTVGGQPAFAYIPGCGHTYQGPTLVGPGHQIEVEGEIACIDPNNPADGAPLAVILQQATVNSSTWRTVASGSGWLVYNCLGTTAHRYRILERTSDVETFNC